MLSKIVLMSSLVLLSACSQGNKLLNDRANGSFAGKYTKTSTLVPINSIQSSQNICVDNFNFLRSAKSDKYQDYSRDYIKVGSGYTFLNVNKNIMGNDAKEVYTMNLDMKLDTLCTKVKYSSYQFIRGKILELSSI